MKKTKFTYLSIGIRESGNMLGVVYVLENKSARRVKVGFTNSYIQDRIKDINRKWSGINGTCQICGGRRLLVNLDGLFPIHQVNGNKCPGSLELPFEKDFTAASSYLKELNTQLTKAVGSEKGSITRKIKTLEKRIKVYSELEKPIGEWKLRVVYHTNSAKDVELKSHELLSNYLDRKTTFGEVFCCSVLEAQMAVEKILNQTGSMSSAIKETI